MQQLNGLADLRKTRLRDFPRLCWFCALALLLFPGDVHSNALSGCCFLSSRSFRSEETGNAIR